MLSQASVAGWVSEKHFSLTLTPEPSHVGWLILLRALRQPVAD
jgi:hypothetical protein